MPLTARRVGEIVRQRLGVAAAGDKQLIAMVNSTIPEALKETGRRIASDYRTRDLLISDPEIVQGAIDTEGRVNLASLYPTTYILKEFIEYGDIYLLPTVVINASEVSVADDTFTTTRARLRAGDKVEVSTADTVPGGLSPGGEYYVTADSTSAGAFKLSATRANVEAGTSIDLTDQGVGNHTITTISTTDHPLQRIAAASVSRYERQFASIFRYYYIQGDTLYVLPRSMAGTVAFAVPTYPNTLAALPESAEAENMFIHTLLEIIGDRRAAASR